MQRIDPIVRTVANLIRMRGSEATMTVKVQGAYDPSTSSVSSVSDSFPVSVLVFDYIKKNDGDTTNAGSLIRTGDKQVFVKADAGLPFPDPLTTTLTIDGRTYRIIVLKALNPSGIGTEAIMYELYVRK